MKKIIKKKEKAEKNTKETKQVTTKKRKLSNLYKFMLLIAFIIIAIVSYILFGKLITLLVLLALIAIMFFTIVLDIYPKNSKMRKIIKTLFLFCIVIGIIGICAFIIFFAYIIVKAPPFDVSLLERSETTVLYDNKNEVYQTLGSEKREKITYDQLPEVFIDALIATEDSRFFQHNGFDAARFIKASLGQLTGGGGGASTLTMQVSKNNFTSNDVSITRKFTDIYFSVFKIEKAFTKQEIIEFYVNNTFLGSNSWGVEQASQTYFGKSVKELNLAEASIIAGLFQAPSDYDPFYYPDAAEARRDTVLSLMVSHGYITEEEKNLAEDIPIKDLLIDSSKISTNEYQGYIDTVVNEIVNKYGIDPYTTSLEIYTNMDRSKQQAVNQIFNGETYTWPNDSVQGGVIALDTSSGKIIAVGAGRNRTGERTFNYATDISRQIGSTAKPLFDYGPGIEYENWSTGKNFNDSPHNYSGGGTMTNYDSRYLGDITLRYSLQDSRNVPALEAFQQLDNAKIKEFVTKLGLTPEIDANGYLHEAHSIGAFNGTSPLQLAGAYQAFSNGGYYYEPSTISKIVFRSSGDEIVSESEKVQVMSDATAYMITNILQGVAKDTGIANYVSGDLAMKTGTTNYDDATLAAKGYPSNATPDGWIAGYTPHIVIAMWTGYVENEEGRYLTQSQMVTQRNGLFRACAKAIMNDQTDTFVKPSSAVWVTVEKGSDPIALPSASTPDSLKITELFKRGTEPTEVSTKYRILDNVTGLNVTLNGTNAKITWNAAPQPSDIDVNQYGSFGYKVYLDNNLLGFTENNYYENNSSNIYGTYKVITCYSSIGSNASSGATVSLESNITFNYTGTTTDSVILNSNYTDADINNLFAYENSNDVTSQATITSTIVDVSGNNVTSINSANTTTTGDTFTITYTITYKGKSKTFSKTVTVN